MAAGVGGDLGAQGGICQHTHAPLSATHSLSCLFRYRHLSLCLERMTAPRVGVVYSNVKAEALILLPPVSHKDKRECVFSRSLRLVLVRADHSSHLK